MELRGGLESRKENGVLGWDGARERGRERERERERDREKGVEGSK